MNHVIYLTPYDWLDLFLHYAVLSLLSVGGTITAAPEMHRFLVDEKHWLSEASFSSSIALAQSSPGPNVLFVALMGWHIGLNAGGGLGGGIWAWSLGMLGVLITMTGVMLPSSVLTYVATKWTHDNRNFLSVRSFKSGLAPLVIGLLVSTGWLLLGAHNNITQDWKLWLLAGVAIVLMLRTSVHILWLMAAGAACGALGWL
jgi:chromate transporter